MKFQPIAFRTSVLASAIVMAGCSVLQEEKIDYRSASRGSSLEVPPDLTQLATDARYNVPAGGAVSANALLGSQIQRSESASVAADAVADVRIHREGNVRWLSVPRSPDVLWDPVREFWLNNGFTLAVDQPQIGILETDWAENRAKLPQDFIRSTIGKVLEGLYSTSERDKFRTRLERRADGGTDIYITHRGMEEEFTSNTKDQTIWRPRAADPELETEFLRRLLVALGTSEEQSRAIAEAGGGQTGPAAVAGTRAAAQVVQIDGVAALELPDNFDRAWRRVGAALDRTGFTVEDRDRSQGIYYVRYISPTAERSEPSFFGRILGRSGAVPPLVKYRIAVQSETSRSLVRVLTEAGQPVSGEEASRIVQLLHEDLR